MKVKCNKIKCIAMMVSLIMVLSLAACGGSNNAETQPDSQSSNAENTTQAVSTTEKAEEPVILKILACEQITNPGIQDNPVANEITKKTGVIIDYISSDVEKNKLILASGDLPDIMVADSQFLQQIIDGKLARPLDDLLQAKGQDILKYNKFALDVTRSKINSDGSYYFLPINANPDSKPALLYTPDLNWYTRWDYYKEIGSPSLDTHDDYINAMLEMVKRHPKTDDGKKIYGISGWTDWGLWPYWIPFTQDQGWYQVLGSLGLYGPEDSLAYLYGQNSPFWNGVEFWYKANKAGLVDPDAFTMKFDGFTAKAKAGQILTLFATWQASDVNATFAGNGNQDKGFESIPTGYSYSTAHRIWSLQAGDGTRYNCITTKCQNPEKAMELLNYLHSYEGSRLIWSGVNGTHWDIENGMPEQNDATFKLINEDKDYMEKTGIFKYNKLSGFDQFAVDPNDGGLMELKNNTKGLVQRLTDLDKDFSAAYGASFPGDVWEKSVKSGKTKTFNLDLRPMNFAKTEPDDIKKIHNKIEEYLTKNTHKMILAKSDSGFTAEKDRQIAELNKIGLQTLEDYVKKQWADCKAMVEAAGK